MNKVLFAAMGVFLFAALGCSESNPLERKAISGEVLFGGVPLEKGLISFSPEDLHGVSTGSVIQDGKYQVDAYQSIPAGKYTVRVTSPVNPPKAKEAAEKAAEIGPGGQEPGSRRQIAIERIPAEYNTKSNKIITVTEEGPNRFDFDIPVSSGD